MHYALTIAHVCPSPLTTTPTAQLVSLQVKSGKKHGRHPRGKSGKDRNGRSTRILCRFSSFRRFLLGVVVLLGTVEKKKRERLLAAPSPTELSAFNVQL
jgi:hypothetical protein